MVLIQITPDDDLSAILQTAAPDTCIQLAAGEYRCKIEITASGITLIGHDPADTRIVWNDYAKKLDKNGVEYNTFRTYTAAVLAPDVTFRNLTIENDAREPETKGQEVALSICADRFHAENCHFLSTQDTVFCGPLPADLIVRYYGFLKDALRAGGTMHQVFENCLIAGNVDFIFGCGDALFENCEIRSVFDVRGIGYAAAPAHGYEQKVGFVFHRCRFTCEKTVPEESVYLARPWRDHGKCSFIDCEYGSHIFVKGFDQWNDSGRDKTARFAESGMIPDGRVFWSRRLDADEVEFLLESFIIKEEPR